MSAWREALRETITTLEKERGEIDGVLKALYAVLGVSEESAKQPAPRRRKGKKPGPKPGKKPGPKPKRNLAGGRRVSTEENGGPGHEEPKAKELARIAEARSEPPIPTELDEDLVVRILEAAVGSAVRAGQLAEEFGMAGPQGRDKVRETMDGMYNRGQLNRVPGPAGWYTAVTE